MVSVAIKTLKEGSSAVQRKKFLQEAAIMGQFKHRNVVNLLGVVVHGEPVRAVFIRFSVSHRHTGEKMWRSLLQKPCGGDQFLRLKAEPCSTLLF